MQAQTTDTTLRSYARFAGIAYLVLIVSGIAAEFFARLPLLVPQDAAATTANVAASASSFRLGIAGDLVMIVCDVALAVVFYLILRHVSQALSLAAALFRLLQGAILGVNLLNLFFVLQLADGAGFMGALDQAQREAWTLFFFEAHGIGYSLGLVFFGVNCLLVGYLIATSGVLPRILGFLLIFAGVGYLADSLASFLLPTYDLYADIFMMVVFLPALIAEVSTALWLIFKGVKVPQVATPSARRLNYAS